MNAALVVLIVPASIYVVGVFVSVVVGMATRFSSYRISVRGAGARMIVRAPMWPATVARNAKDAWDELVEDARAAR